MNSVLRGLNAIKEGSKRASSGEGRFLKIGDGEAVSIRFLQELDPSGKNYDDKRGTAIGIYEHVNPEDWSKSFLCIKEDEGRCLGCEKVPLDKKWRPRGRLLINVLVRGTRGEESKVKIFTTGLGNRGLTPQLVELSEEFGTLCDRDYRLKRSGEGLDTTYTLIPREVSALKKDEYDMEIIDFEDVYRHLSYEEQVSLLESDDDGKSDW